MTDKDIIKASECCSKNPNTFICAENDCPLFGQNCGTILSKNALDLINRQQGKIDYQKAEINLLKDEKTEMSVEIIRQQAEIERLTININAFGLGMKREKERADTIRAEAIKEFAERLKEKNFCFGSLRGVELVSIYAVELKDIDNLVKEMVGEDK